MKMFVFAVFDVKASVYSAPFFARSKGEAVRSFMDACDDDKLPFKRYPGDFQLFWIDEWDDNSGNFDGRSPELLLTASAAIVEKGA